MLGDRTSQDVTGIVRGCFGAAPMPYLTDASMRQRAIETARGQGLLERLASDSADGEPIRVLPYTRLRDYQRDGNRTRFEALQRERTARIDRVAMACALGIDRLDELHDLLWAECETTWWGMPAHERHGTPIDLRVALLGRRYATILTLLAETIAPEVRERMLDEINRRILRPYLDPAAHHHWKFTTNNWNAVCIANVAITAMLIETESARLARLIVDALEHLPNFLAGFTADGGCTEGPSYWRFGFGWYIHLAAALYDYTGGRIDIARGETIGAICRYPLSVSLGPGKELTFADAHAGWQDPVVVTLINRFHDVPELFGLCAARADGTPELASIEALLLYDGWTASPPAETGDHWLKDLGICRVRAGATVVGAKAGHNAEHHNHNDVGSFLVFRDGQTYLTDPGAPIYSARTFSDRRYESLFCNSWGHSVPVIAGHLQPPGRDYAGRLEVAGLAGHAAKTLRIALADAYDVDSLERLDRVIELARDGMEVRLADTVAFSGAGEAIEEAFITAHAAEVSEDARAVTIRPQGASSAVLSADGQGRFAVEELTEASRREARGGEILRRITFTPPAAAREQTLRFVLRFGS